MMIGFVVTETATLFFWPSESLNVTLHEPAAEPVTVKVALGPGAVVGVTVAIPEHVSVWLKIMT